MAVHKTERFGTSIRASGKGKQQMMVVTTDEIVGRRIVAAVGLVLGLAVRGRGLGGNIMAGLHALGNDTALDEYRDELALARREALAHLVAQATEQGAHAIVGLRFDTAAVGHDMSEIVAYGTAVTLAHEA